MDNFTAVARNKISSIIRRDDFVRIISINNDSVVIEISSDKCTIDPFGKVFHQATSAQSIITGRWFGL